MTLSFVEYLQEARRNPEMNPRIGPLTRLEEYKDDPNIFISFTEIDKAGLKPLSDYNTPLGVYTYPLKVSWDYYGVGKTLKGILLPRKLKNMMKGRSEKLPPSALFKAEKSAIQRAFPFATENPYIQVIRAKKPLTDLQKFIKQDLLNTLNAIEELLLDMSADPDEIIPHVLSTAESNARIKTAGGTFWYLTYLLTNPYEQNINLPSHTTVYLGKHSFLDRYKTKKPMRAWNYLLRELGHDGFLDNGDSIIHPGEPAQAVFLHRKAFKKVDRVLNKPSALSQKKKRVRGTWMNDNKISKDAKWYIINEGTEDIPAVIRWESGTFIDGVWKVGRFEGGTWLGGTWEMGSWTDGTWKGGVFKSGSFSKGVWENGVVEGGEESWYTVQFEAELGDVIWLNGHWKVPKSIGVFEKGKWYDGIFDGPTSAFKDSVWKKGIFKNGKFMNSKWENGVFEGGIFAVNSSWSNGIFKGGVFMDSFWENGVWEGGTWKNGTIYSHKFKDYVNDSKINPAEFYEIEAEVDSIEELRERAQNP